MTIQAVQTVHKVKLLCSELQERLTRPFSVLVAPTALYSSSEWTLSGTFFEGRELYRGKWGHTVEAFFTREDLNNDGSISTNDAHIEFVNNRKSAVKFRNQTVSGDENKIPALFVIAGKPEGSQLVNDVFVTRPGCKNRTVTGVIK